jgi:hypothetical protein
MIPDISHLLFSLLTSDHRIAISSWEWDAPGSEIEVFGDPDAARLMCTWALSLKWSKMRATKWTLSGPHIDSRAGHSGRSHTLTMT